MQWVYNGEHDGGSASIIIDADNKVLTVDIDIYGYRHIDDWLRLTIEPHEVAELNAMLTQWLEERGY